MIATLLNRRENATRGTVGPVREQTMQNNVGHEIFHVQTGTEASFERPRRKLDQVLDFRAEFSGWLTVWG